MCLFEICFMRKTISVAKSKTFKYLFEGELPENEEPAATFGFVTDTRPMAQCCVNKFFHDSILCSNIQGSNSCLEKKLRKRKRTAVFSFSACVVAVATLDGCVCQGGRPCSLMMAMPAHKPSPTDVCLCVYICVCDFFQDG